MDGEWLSANVNCGKIIQKDLGVAELCVDLCGFASNAMNLPDNDTQLFFDPVLL